MKGKFILSMLTAIVGVALTLGVSAFKNEKPVKSGTQSTDDVIYFQYSGPNEADANLKSSTYWTEISGLPESNPCTPGTIVCVSHLDDETLQSQPGIDNKARFMYYLNNIVDPSDYVQANSDWEKQQ